MSAPTKISVYSLPGKLYPLPPSLPYSLWTTDLKATLDDHLPIYLTSPNLPSTSGSPLPKSLRFSPSATHTYVRLALGYSSVFLALYLFYLDYYLKIPFRSHKVAAAWCALGYFILNGGLTAWIWAVEKGIVFAGTRARDGVDLKVYSVSPKVKGTPGYRLLVEWTEKGKGSVSEEREAEFVKFFAEDGTFVAERFETWLREVLPVLKGAEKDGAAVGTGADGTTSGIEVGNATTATKRRI